MAKKRLRFTDIIDKKFNYNPPGDRKHNVIAKGELIESEQGDTIRTLGKYGYKRYTTGVFKHPKGHSVNVLSKGYLSFHHASGSYKDDTILQSKDLDNFMTNLHKESLTASILQRANTILNREGVGGEWECPSCERGNYMTTTCSSCGYKLNNMGLVKQDTLGDDHAAEFKRVYGSHPHSYGQHSHNPEPPKVITLHAKYYGKCDHCKGPIAKGSEVKWDPKSKKIWHPHHYRESTEVSLVDRIKILQNVLAEGISLEEAHDHSSIADNPPKFIASHHHEIWKALTLKHKPTSYGAAVNIFKRHTFKHGTFAAAKLAKIALNPVMGG